MFFTYTGVRVTDLDRSLEFYKKVMGMKVGLRGRMKHGGMWVNLKSPGSQQKLELNWYPSDSEFYSKYVGGEELDHLAFWCENVTRDFARLVKKGAAPAVQPFIEGQYELAFVKDPDGIWIELIGKARKKKKQTRS